MEDIERWKIKRLLQNLKRIKGEGTSMISLIIPPKEQLSKFSTKLVAEYGAAHRIKDRVNRLSVLAAITSAQQRLKLYRKVPQNGLVIYCGYGNGKKINLNFEPFKPLNQSIYFCGDCFDTKPLQELLETDEKYGFIIIDGHSCLYGCICGNNREILHDFSVNLPKKHNKGGQSALRFERLRMESRHNYVKKATEKATNIFVTNNKSNISGLFLAGLTDFKQDLYEMLVPQLRTKIIKIVDISYGGSQGFNEAIDKCSEELSGVELMRKIEFFIKVDFLFNGS